MKYGRFDSDDWEPFRSEGETFYKCPQCKAITSDPDEHAAWHERIDDKGDTCLN